MADLRSRKRLTVAALLGLLGVMVGLTAFAAPLYDYFVLESGYGGASRTATVAPNEIIDR